MSGTEDAVVRAAPRGGPGRWLLYAAAGLVVATAVATLVVARYTRPLAEQLLTNTLGTPVAIRGLSVSWLGATVSAADIVVGTADQRFSVARLAVTARLLSLLRGEIVVDEAVLDGVTGGLEIAPDHRVRIDGLPAPDPKAESASASERSGRSVRIRRLVANDVQLAVRHALQGSARALAVRVDHGEAKDLRVGFDGSHLQLDAEVRGDADGVPMTAAVKVTPAGDTQAIGLRVDVAGLTLPTPLLDLPLQVAGLAGTLSGTLTYRSEPLTGDDSLQVDAELQSMQLPGAAEARFAAQAIAVERLRVDLAKSSVDLGHVTVTTPSLAVALTPDGVVLPGSSAPPSVSSQDRRWTIAAGRIDVSGGDVTLLRNGSRYVLAIDAGHWDDISSSSASALRIEARAATGGTVAASGTLILEPMSLDLVVDVAKVALPKQLVDLPPAVASVTGTLDGSVTYRRRAVQNESLVRLDLQVQAPRIAGRAETEAAARSLKLDGLQVDLAGARLELGTITVSAPSVTIALTSDGVVLPVEAAASTAAATGMRWTIAGGRVNVRGGDVTLRRGPNRYALQVDSGRWEDIASTGAIQLKGRPADGGSVVLSGAFGLGSDTVALVVDANEIQLASLAAVAPDLPLRISRGTASGKVSIDGAMATPRLRGTLQLDQVYTVPPVASRPDEVLAAHRIEATATIDLGRNSVEVDRLTLRYPYAMVQRSPGGVFPYSSLGATADAAPAAGQPIVVRIEELEIVGGRADFLDRTLEPQYWTALADVAAGANGILLPGPEVHDFRVSARQDEINPVEVTGTADENGWRVQADLRTVFLPTLNTYLAPLLGYKATTGVLSLEIAGRLSADALHTQNRVTLRNVSMSQTGLDIIQQSTGVPLPIALALLRDTSGTIELMVPITGDPRAGRFRLGSLIDQALSKAVQSALTAPLRILGLLFGTQGPPRALAVDPIPFVAGSGVLDIAAEARLEQIARILAAHTELTMVAKPEVSVADVAVVGNDGLEQLAAARAAAVTEALVDGQIHPQLPQQRLVMVPWRPPTDGVLTPRSGVYVELQLSADYGK